MPAPVIHFEIMGGKGNDLQNFYRDAFGWSIDANNPMNYGMVSAQDGQGIGGGVGPDEQPRVTVYLEVPDLDAALRKIEGLGGQVIMQPEEVPGGPLIAMFRDPAGNTIGLVKAGSM